MKKSVHIFRSVEEQELYHKKLMACSTAADRFRKLYQMQLFNQLLHPVADKSRKIRIGKWTS
ncbi:MAG: hypothetical protein JNM19_02080 [Chitinophagaceae bacterium]|nr:hypothetical protein [Chitinophagaceae bacterium]